MRAASEGNSAGRGGNFKRAPRRRLAVQSGRALPHPFYPLLKQFVLPCGVLPFDVFPQCAFLLAVQGVLFLFGKEEEHQINVMRGIPKTDYPHAARLALPAGAPRILYRPLPNETPASGYAASVLPMPAPARAVCNACAAVSR